MFFFKNLKFLFQNVDKTKFCNENNIKYRTFQDIYLGTTKDPRLSVVIKIAKGLNISIEDLLFKDLSNNI